MYEKLGLSIQDDIDATTVSGFVTELMDKIPEAGEILNLDHMDIEVTKANAKHVQEVKVTLKDESGEEDEKPKKGRAFSCGGAAALQSDIQQE